jgi:hypothetical protein
MLRANGRLLTSVGLRAIPPWIACFTKRRKIICHTTSLTCPVRCEVRMSKHSGTHQPLPCIYISELPSVACMAFFKGRIPHRQTISSRRARMVNHAVLSRPRGGGVKPLRHTWKAQYFLEIFWLQPKCSIASTRRRLQTRFDNPRRIYIRGQTSPLWSPQ